LGDPEGGEVCGVAGPLGEIGSCDESAVEASCMSVVVLKSECEAYIMLASLLFQPVYHRAQSRVPVVFKSPDG
jgi:hypothetical protein